MAEASTKEHSSRLQPAGNGVHHILPRCRPPTVVVHILQAKQSLEVVVRRPRMGRYLIWDMDTGRVGTMLQVDSIQRFTTVENGVVRMVSTVDMGPEA